MNNLYCDDIRQTLSMGDARLDVRTTDEHNNGCVTDVENIPLVGRALLMQQIWTADIITGSVIKLSSIGILFSSIGILYSVYNVA